MARHPRARSRPPPLTITTSFPPLPAPPGPGLALANSIAAPFVRPTPPSSPEIIPESGTPVLVPTPTSVYASISLHTNRLTPSPAQASTASIASAPRSPQPPRRIVSVGSTLTAYSLATSEWVKCPAECMPEPQSQLGIHTGMGEEDKPADDPAPLTPVAPQAPAETAEAADPELLLPPTKSAGWLRRLRWTTAKPYMCLVYTVLLANFGYLLYIILISLVSYRQERFVVGERAMVQCAQAASINLGVAVAFRNEFIINAIYAVVSNAPRSIPLPLRCLLAKSYSFGGIHSGCAVAATGWHSLATAAVLWWLFDKTALEKPPLVLPLAIVSITTLIFLSTICISALPCIRRRFHNLFEQIHRFGGWLITFLFWAQSILLVYLQTTQQATDRSVGSFLIRLPSFWIVIFVTLSVAQPWFRTRRKQIVRVEFLGGHAVRLFFSGRVPSCMGVRLATNPLLETHAFATIPEPFRKKEFSVMVSDAGDWSQKIVRNPPSHLWIRGGPVWGVLRNTRLFETLVIVATGTGIGPCLGLFNEFRDIKCRVLWSARSPGQIYGPGVVSAVLRADHCARIIDTKQSGRIDMVTEAYRLYRESSAEAVFCISNEALTRQIVRGLEERGIPAFGPIWDS